MIITADFCSFKEEELKELFTSVGWHYSKKLHASLEASSHIVAAFEDDKLIGLARSMDDNLWQANIDTLLVHKKYQHQGIGSALIRGLLYQISHIEYINVCTNCSELVEFYNQLGFKDINGLFLQRQNS